MGLAVLENILCQWTHRRVSERFARALDRVCIVAFPFTFLLFEVLMFNLKFEGDVSEVSTQIAGIIIAMVAIPLVSTVLFFVTVQMFLHTFVINWWLQDQRAIGDTVGLKISQFEMHSVWSYMDKDKSRVVDKTELIQFMNKCPIYEISDSMFKNKYEMIRQFITPNRTNEFKADMIRMMEEWPNEIPYGDFQQLVMPLMSECCKNMRNKLVKQH